MLGVAVREHAGGVTASEPTRHVVSRATPIVPLCSAVFGVVLVAASIATFAVNDANLQYPPPSRSLFAQLVLVPTVLAGATLAVIRRAARLGVWLAGGALSIGLARLAWALVDYASSPGGNVPAVGFIGAIGNALAWVGAVGIATAVLVGFPSGRVRTRLQRLTLGVAGAGLGLVIAAAVFSPGAVDPDLYGTGPSSPFAVGWFGRAVSTTRNFGVLVLAAAGVLGAASWLERRASGLWCRACFDAVALGIATVGLAWSLTTVDDSVRVAALALSAVALPAVVAAAAIAASRAAVADARVDDALVRWRGRLRGGFDAPALATLAVARIVALTWAAALVMTGHNLQRPTFARLLLVGAGLLAATAAVLVVRGEDRRRHRPVVVLELALAACVVAADGAVHGDAHLFNGAVGLGGPWPHVVVVATAVVLGPLAGGLGGAVVGAAKFMAVDLNGASIHGGRAEGLVGNLVGLVALGVVAGIVANRLRGAEATIATQRARDAVAAKLHDGVLQTLAIVARRSTDRELVRLARDSDAELRSYLSGATESDAYLESALHRAAAGARGRFGLRVEVVIPDEPPPLERDTMDALAAAVDEALANVAKHAGTDAATVFAGEDAQGRFLVSVVDGGVGVAGSADGRMGIAKSIQGRLEAVGGHAEVRPNPAGGTEVLLWPR